MPRAARAEFHYCSQRNDDRLVTNIPMAEEEREGKGREGRRGEGTPGENLIGLFRSVDVSLLCLTEMILAAATTTIERLEREREREREREERPIDNATAFRQLIQRGISSDGERNSAAPSLNRSMQSRQIDNSTDTAS